MLKFNYIVNFFLTDSGMKSQEMNCVRMLNTYYTVCNQTRDNDGF